MKIQLELQENLAAGLKRRGERVKTGANTAVREESQVLQDAMRAQVRPALGGQAAQAIRRRVYIDPHKAAGIVVSAWRRPAAAGGREPRDILAAYASGVTITPVKGRWLAIPTPDARVRGTVRNIDYWAASKGIRLEFVPPAPGRAYAMLVEAARSGTVRRRGVPRVRTRTFLGQARKVMFILIKLHRLPKKLDFAAPVQAARTRLPATLLQQIGLERD